MGKNMKGQVFAWLAILVIMFTFILIYNIFTYPMTLTHEAMTDIINDSNSSMATDALNTMDIIQNVWTYWPVVLIFFLLIWGLVAAQRREPVQYYG